MRITHYVFISLVPLAAACEWNDKQAIPVDASTQPRPDGVINPGVDAADVDAPDVTPTGHLLLSEIALQPTGGEFVEIMNPTASSISLANYYLADVGDYWKLPAAVPSETAADFIVKFPMTASIPAGGAITVAVQTSATFNTAYGVMPTYSIADAATTLSRIAGGTAPSLTDAGEIVVLFQWGGTGLVKDVDVMIAGAPTTANTLVSKSGQAVASMTYATDADSIQAQLTAPGNGVSTKRKLAETGHETQDGVGNGLTGDDETSEDTRMTWDSTYTAATPNVAPTLP